MVKERKISEGGGAFVCSSMNCGLGADAAEDDHGVFCRTVLPPLMSCEDAWEFFGMRPIFVGVSGDCRGT